MSPDAIVDLQTLWLRRYKEINITGLTYQLTPPFSSTRRRSCLSSSGDQDLQINLNYEYPNVIIFSTHFFPRGLL